MDMRRVHAIRARGRYSYDKRAAHNDVPPGGAVAFFAIVANASAFSRSSSSLDESLPSPSLSRSLRIPLKVPPTKPQAQDCRGRLSSCCLSVWQSKTQLQARVSAQPLTKELERALKTTHALTRVHNKNNSSSKPSC